MAKALEDLLQGISAEIKLTPFNPREGSEFRPPTEQRLLAFRKP